MLAPLYITHTVSFTLSFIWKREGVREVSTVSSPYRPQAEEVIPLWVLKLEVVTKGLVFPISTGQTDLVEFLENSTLASNIYTFCPNEMHFISAYVYVIESLVWPEFCLKLRGI